MSASNASYLADKKKIELLHKLQQLRGGIGHAQYKRITQLPLFYLGGRNSSSELDLAKLEVVTQEMGLVAGLFSRGSDGTMPGEPSLYAENVDNVLSRLHRRLQLVEGGVDVPQPQKPSVLHERQLDLEPHRPKPSDVPGLFTPAAVSSPSVHPQPLSQHQYQHQPQREEHRRQGPFGHQQPGKQTRREEKNDEEGSGSGSTEFGHTESDQTSDNQWSADDHFQNTDNHADFGDSVCDPTDEIVDHIGQGSRRDSARDKEGRRGREDGGGIGKRKSNGNGNIADVEQGEDGAQDDDDERTVNTIIDTNKRNGQVFDMRRWRASPKTISVPTYCDGRPNGVFEYVSSTVENLSAATQEPFPCFETPQDNKHGLSQRDYQDMKRLSARLKVVIRVQLSDPNTGERFVEYFIRATDGEVQAALNEDGAAAAITVGVYTRAASMIRSRQAASRAAKDSAKAALATAAAAAVPAAGDADVNVGNDGFVCTRTGADTGTSTSAAAGAGVACDVMPWQKRARTS